MVLTLPIMLGFTAHIFQERNPRKWKECAVYLQVSETKLILSFISFNKILFNFLLFQVRHIK